MRRTRRAGVVVAGLTAAGLAVGPVAVGSPAAGASAVPTAPQRSAVGPLVPPPDSDPFYRPPAGFGARANGAVLRSRAVTATALGVPLPATSWQLLYRSTDSGGGATADVATVMVPTAPWTGTGPRPLVSYQTAEDSVSTRCAPSYALRAGLAAGTSNAASESTIIASTLARGWAVVTADYEGPQSQFLAAGQTAHAVLDGIRAARAFPPARVAARAPVGLWGYSGGAFATAWAVQLQPSYASELRFVGVAVGGVPADLEASMRRIDGGYGSGLVVGGLIGLLRAYPASGVATLFTPDGRTALAAGGDDCTADLLLRYPFRPVNSFTTTPAPFDAPVLRALLHRNSPLGHGAPTAPVYSYHAEGDELVPVAVGDALADAYCAAGTPVQRVRFPGGEHNLTLLAGVPGAQAFLANRFVRAAPVDDC